MNLLASIVGFCDLIVWLIVSVYALPHWWRVVCGRVGDDVDFKQAALGLVGIAIIIFRLNAIANHFTPRNYWSLAGLTLLAAAGAVVIFCIHLPRTPPGHKRAMVLTHLAILALCVAGGLLA